MFKWYMTENFSLKVLEICGSYIQVFTVYQEKRQLDMYLLSDFGFIFKRES